MTDRVHTSPNHLGIAAVERDTGLSKDTLRVWERRYGFPAPLRDASGERAYPDEQVEKLRLLRRLIDQGERPGRIVALPMPELRSLLDESAGRQPRAPARPHPVEPFVEMLRAHDVVGLRRQLRHSRERLGLARFVTEVVAPLNTLVGEGWMRGQLQVFQEHLYTESLQVVLRDAIAGIPASGDAARPRVLLTTLPAEPHGLGLLMAEALLALEGAHCVSLGVGTPLWDIVLAARAQCSDIVALSFSGYMNPTQTVDSLKELRAKLPEQAALWAGGAAPALHRRPLPGVRPIASIGEIHAELLAWRHAARP